MQIRDHRLIKWDDSQPPQWQPYSFKESPNQSGGFRPEGLCIHYTAGMSLDRVVKTLTNPKRKASAHLIIGRDGEIAQLVPFDRKAWHAGKSQDGSRKSCNRFMFGVELVNAGWLTEKEDRYYTWSFHEIPGAEVFEDEEHYWQEYTHPQLEALIDVCECLIDEYGVTFITGHSDIAIPDGRKVDPGPAFPMEEMRKVLFPPDSRCDPEDE